MATIEWGEYRPDVSDINRAFTDSIANVVPRADGYGPVKTPVALTQTLPAACRGYFEAQDADGSVRIFAGTATNLYLLDNTTLTWAEVSKGGNDYTELASDAHWSFAQFNTFVIAVQANTAPQVYQLGVSAAFADLGGSPPQAGGVAIINRFAVLYDLASNSNRIHWSGLNAITTWTSGTNYSDYQDFPDGGRVRGVAGSEYGLILQQRAIRRMVFVPGAPITFQIERLANDRGIFAPYSLCQGGSRVFFLSSNGFVEATTDGNISEIGFEKVDRTILTDIDDGELQMCIGAVDPRAYLAVFVYKSVSGGIEGQFNKAIAYNWQLKRWSPFALSGEYLAQAATPGVTLDGLDTLAPGYSAVSDAVDNGSGLVRLTVGSTAGWATGDYKTIASVGGTTEANGTWEIEVIDATTIDLIGTTFANAYTSGGYVAGVLDDLETPLDEISTSSLPNLSIIDGTHALAYFTGDALEATLETAETIGTRQRVHVNGGQPITDAESCFLSVGGREKLNGAMTYGDESELDDDGYCPLLDNVRSGRMKLRIPAGETWTFATGVTPELMPAGRF